MIELVIGAALVGGAALLGRAKQSLGAPIMPWTSDNDFLVETRKRAIKFSYMAGEAIDDLYSMGRCDLSRQAYFRALGLLKEARAATRHPRMNDLVRRCAVRKTDSSGGWATDPDLSCYLIRDIRSGMETGHRDLKDLRSKEYPKNCPDESSLPSVPLSGLDKPITPTMRDLQFTEELLHRAKTFRRQADITQGAVYAVGDYVLIGEKEAQCKHARATYKAALRYLQEARQASRSARVPKIIKKYDCFRGQYGGHPACRELEEAASFMDEGLGLLKQAVEDDWFCSDRLKPVPLSGLEKPITKQMIPSDFVDELVFRTEQFRNAHENTYREIYDEADPDKPNNPKCEAAIASYRDTLGKMKESEGAMRAPHASKLIKRCRSRRGGEICRRFVLASRIHRDLGRAMPRLKGEVEKWCSTKVPSP